jgi:hypothetical protein
MRVTATLQSAEVGVRFASCRVDQVRKAACCLTSSTGAYLRILRCVQKYRCALAGAAEHVQRHVYKTTGAETLERDHDPPWFNSNRSLSFGVTK